MHSFTSHFSFFKSSFYSVTPPHPFSISSSLPYLNYFSPSHSPVLHFTNLLTASSCMNHPLSFPFPFLSTPVCSIPTFILRLFLLCLVTPPSKSVLLHLSSLVFSPDMARMAYFSEEVLSVDCSPGWELLSSTLGSQSHGSLRSTIMQILIPSC